MTKTLSPKNDFVFQKLFGTEENKDLLIALLNAILELPPDKMLADLTVIGGARLDRERLEDKTGILDVRATTNKGTIINIEVQILSEKSDKICYPNKNIIRVQSGRPVIAAA